MMPANRFKRLARGDYLEADWLNGLAGAVERLLRIRVTAPLTLTWAAGVPTIGVGNVSSAVLTVRIVARGTGAFYSWQEVKPTTGGSWIDGTRSGTTTTNNALEQNTNTAVPAGVRVQLFRVNGQWIFQLGPCTPIGKSPVIPPLPQQSLAIIPPPQSTGLIATTQVLQGGTSGPQHTTPIPP